MMLRTFYGRLHKAFDAAAYSLACDEQASFHYGLPTGRLRDMPWRVSVWCRGFMGGFRWQKKSPARKRAGERGMNQAAEANMSVCCASAVSEASPSVTVTASPR